MLICASPAASRLLDLLEQLPGLAASVPAPTSSAARLILVSVVRDESAPHWRWTISEIRFCAPKRDMAPLDKLTI
jgi:hypothetical protein